MSEKRFTLRDGLTFEFSNIQDNGNDLSFEDIVDLLNEMSEKLGKKEKSVKLFFKFKELEEENEKLRKQVAEYELILRQHEFAEKEGVQ